MKKIFQLSIYFIALNLCAIQSIAQTADLQVIHNAADPSAATVDIYVDGALALNDFAFRTASPFLSLPAGVILNIGVAPPTSTSVNDTLVNFEVSLVQGERYAAIANGVLNPLIFDGNPDGASTAFTLFLKDGLQAGTGIGTDVDFVVCHGATDAPTVDVIARNVATLVNDASYGDITSYISVPASSYILDITPAAGNPIVASFEADLSGLGGGTAIVFASGFLDPTTNQNGPAFGLFAALESGTVVPLPATSTARLQVIHNAADPAANSVDVYVNGSLLLDDFAFRTATPYIDVPAGVILNIGVAPGASTSVNDTLKNFEVTLANGGTYLAMANGVLNPAGFAANPDAVSTAFTLFLQDEMREMAGNMSDIDLRVIHGSSDAPSVDVIARRVATIVNDAPYGAITPYITVPAATYTLDVTPAAGSPIVASFLADLSTIGGGSAVVFASGFLDPSSNQNGDAFGLFAALGDGSVIALPATSTARLQVIHNAADPSANSVDVYVNGNLLLDDFAFRTATPYIDVPAGVALNIGVAPGTSSSVNDTLKNFEVTLDNGETYIAVANGVLNPAGFAANPDAISTAFTLFFQDQMSESAANINEVGLRVIHGSTDAPTVDVLTGTTILVDNAPYGAITSYLNVPAADYQLDITPGNDNNIIVASFSAPISGLGGNTAVVLASGFLDPSANQNGFAFTLIAVLTDGTVITLNNVTGIDNIDLGSNINLYPNPAREMINISINDKVLAQRIDILNLQGRLVYSSEINNNSLAIPVDLLPSGIYGARIETNKGIHTSRFVLN